MNIEPQKEPSNNREWHYFYAALMFYTRLPVPKDTPHSTDILNKSRLYFPFIGILIGSISIFVYLISELFFSTPISIAFSMVATILATGAFHEDGFADTCDGLGGGWEAKQVLSIMKDSRLGTYASIGLVSILGIKFLALLDLSTISLSAFAFCIIAAHTFSRLIASLTIDAFDYVQDNDKSKVKPVTDSRLSSSDLHATFIITALPVLLLAFVALIPTLCGIFCASITGKLFAKYSRKRIGGVTGDILGAIQQLSELAFYLGFLAFL